MFEGSLVLRIFLSDLHHQGRLDHCGKNELVTRERL